MKKLNSLRFKMAFTFGFILSLVYTSSGQSNYKSHIILPIRVKNSEIKRLIDNSTPPRMRIRGENNNRTKRHNLLLNISDNKSIFNSNNITHYLRITSGSGNFGRRGYGTNPLNGQRIYSHWTTLECNEFRGNVKVSFSTKITNKYQILANTTIDGKMDHVVCGGINITGLLKAFGVHHFKDDVSKKFNEELKKVGFKSKVNELWKNIQRPISIDNTTFLLISPRSLIYKDSKFTKTDLNLAVGLNFFAKTGNKKDAMKWIPNIPLPDLNKISKLPQNNLVISTPLKLGYSTIEKQAKGLLIGEFIKAKNKKGKEIKYAQIRDVNIKVSSEDKYDIVLGLNVKILKPVFKKKMGFLYLHIKLSHDATKKILYIDRFKLDAKTDSWLANNSLEAIANLIAYKFLKKKMHIYIPEKIDKQKVKINAKLVKGIKLTNDIILTGNLNTIKIQRIKPKIDHLFLHFILNGNIALDVIHIGKN